MTDVTTSGLYLALTGVIGYLFKLVLDRCYRAEKQVDTLIPLASAMVAELKAVREEMARDFKAVREEMARDLRERHQSQGEPGGDWPGRRT